MLNEKSMADTLAYLTRWLLSLQPATADRKKEALPALRQIVLAATDTAGYLASVSSTGSAEARVEARLAREWTKLSHLMRNIGNAGLAKRCQVKGGLWVDATALLPADVEKARAELLAVNALAEPLAIEIGGPLPVIVLPVKKAAQAEASAAASASTSTTPAKAGDKKAGAKAAAKPVAKPKKKLAAAPVGKPAGKPAGRTAANPVGKAAGKPAENPAGKPAGKPAGRPAGKRDGKAAEKTDDRPARKPPAKRHGRR